MSNSKFGLRTRKGLIRPYIEGAQAVLFDADALAYITANTAITSTADKNAINTFFLGLKSDGIYSKIKAMYLPIWGTSTNCKFNLVAPNGSYDLTFMTGWTFTSGGMTPSSTYANTNMFPSELTNVNSHMSYYSRTNSGISAWEFGAASNTNNDSFYMQFNGSNYLVNIQGGNAGGTVGSTNGCFLIGSMLSGVQTSLYRNGSLLNTSAVGTLYSLPTNAKIYLGATSYGNAVAAYGFRQCAFSSVGGGLTATQAASLSNRVNTLMTYFGINVY